MNSLLKKSLTVLSSVALVASLTASPLTGSYYGESSSMSSFRSRLSASSGQTSQTSSSFRDRISGCSTTTTPSSSSLSSRMFPRYTYGESGGGSGSHSVVAPASVIGQTLYVMSGMSIVAYITFATTTTFTGQIMPEGMAVINGGTYTYQALGGAKASLTLMGNGVTMGPFTLSFTSAVGGTAAGPSDIYNFYLMNMQQP
jgi:hypothetical protein